MMKKRFLLVTSLVTILAAIPAAGQHFDENHRHAVEVTTGIPPIHGWGFLDAIFDSIFGQGIHSEFLGAASANVGYTFCLSERWDINAVVNGCFGFFKISKYPVSIPAGTQKQDGTYAERDEYNYNADPVSVWTKMDPSLSLMVDFRFKWYRSDMGSLYSALGAGVVMFDPFTTRTSLYPTPYITPIGAKYGGNHLYLVAELNVSSAATLLLIGAGWRF